MGQKDNKHCRYQDDCIVYIGYREYCPESSKLCIIAKTARLDKLEYGEDYKEFFFEKNRLYKNKVNSDEVL